jgi:2'-5' RNA ligase
MKRGIQGQLKLFEEKKEQFGDYYLLFRPEEKILSKIEMLNSETDIFLKENICSWRIPHISLLRFPWRVMEENDLIQIIENLLANYDCPQLRTSSIEEYNSGVVYVKLENQDNALNFRDHLLNGLKYAIGLYNPKRSNKTRIDLHITIAKDLDKEKIKSLLDHLRKFEFEPIEFKCTLVLLRRSASGKKWEKVIEFDF